MKTWVFELLGACSVLSVSALAAGGGAHWLSALAVALSFCHAQVASRLDEAEERRSQIGVHCRAWLARYLVAKEIAWVSYFVLTGSWPALVGCVLFLAYPVWRRWWRS